jgi:DNA-3-methyladenine glycosylase
MSGGHHRKVPRDFYTRSAVESATSFLGKTLVHETEFGRVSGVIYDVEAYPAFADDVHHGNKRTPRTEVMWGPPGYAYVYVIYGVWDQFAVVVNRENIPDVVFIRGAIPQEGLGLMRARWDRVPADDRLADSPGKLCKSFAITRRQYGADLCSDQLHLEDSRIDTPADAIRSTPRVGINTARRGHDALLRFSIPPTALVGV